jgi:hypothetical protein
VTGRRAGRLASATLALLAGATPVAGDVLDMGTASIEDEVERIEENFRRTGSDHYPIIGTVEL